MELSRENKLFAFYRMTENGFMPTVVYSKLLSTNDCLINKIIYIITCVCVCALCEAIHTHTNFRFFAASRSIATS